MADNLNHHLGLNPQISHIIPPPLVTFLSFIKLTVSSTAKNMDKSRQDSFLKLYEPVHDRFERFCRARVFGRGDYRDLMNDTLLVAFQKFETLQSEKAFLSFLFSCAVNILGNQIQKKKELAFQRDNDFHQLKDEKANAQSDADVYFLHQALSQIPYKISECLILFEISGFSIREIAEIEKTSENAVKQRLKRGREKLKAILVYESSNKTNEV
jgi:RNA polymerase sigma-70 factor (ECF subfamily)